MPSRREPLTPASPPLPSRRRLPGQPNRNKKILVAFTADEYAELKALAASLDTKPATLAYSLVLRGLGSAALDQAVKPLSHDDLVSLLRRAIQELPPD